MAVEHRTRLFAGRRQEPCGSLLLETDVSGRGFLRAHTHGSSSVLVPVMLAWPLSSRYDTTTNMTMTIASAAADAGLHVRHQKSSHHAVMSPEISCTHLHAGAWLRRTPINVLAGHLYATL
jgi:hypothetical protein